jgi:hypothetical protein
VVCVHVYQQPVPSRLTDCGRNRLRLRMCCPYALWRRATSGSTRTTISPSC